MLGACQIKVYLQQLAVSLSSLFPHVGMDNSVICLCCSSFLRAKRFLFRFLWILPRLWYFFFLCHVSDGVFSVSFKPPVRSSFSRANQRAKASPTRSWVRCSSFSRASSICLVCLEARESYTTVLNRSPTMVALDWSSVNCTARRINSLLT